MAPSRRTWSAAPRRYRPASHRAKSYRQTRPRAGTGPAAWPIGHQASRFDKLASKMNRRQSQSDRQDIDSIPVDVDEGVAANINCVHATIERVEGGHDILGLPDFECRDLKTEFAGRCLNFADFQHGLGIRDIDQYRQAAETGDHFAQKFETLASNIGLLDRQAGDIAARSRQARHHAASNGVRPQGEDDRDHRRRLLCRRGGVSSCENDVDLEADEFGRDLAETLSAPLRPAILDYDVTPLDPSELAQSLHKRAGPVGPG